MPLSGDIYAQGDNAHEANSQVQAPRQRVHIVQNQEIWSYDEVCFSTAMCPSEGGTPSRQFSRGVAAEGNLGVWV